MTCAINLRSDDEAKPSDLPWSRRDQGERTDGTLQLQRAKGLDHMIGHVAGAPTPAERLRALEVCAEALRNGYPMLQTWQRVAIDGKQVEVTALFHWPGFVRITEVRSHRFVAQSLLGSPFELDAAAPDIADRLVVAIRNSGIPC